MATRVKRRDVAALIALIALELALLCLLGVTFRLDGGDRDLATRGAARIPPLAFSWRALVPEALAPAPAEAAPAEPPKPAAAPVRRSAAKRTPAQPAEVVRRPESPAIAQPATPALAVTVPRSDTRVGAIDLCEGNLCCEAATAVAAGARRAASGGGFEEAGYNPDRVVITWPASPRDDVVYRVFTLPGRRFVGSSGENWLTHERAPGDPDCYTIQACDRAAAPAGRPLTICISRRTTWG